MEGIAEYYSAELSQKILRGLRESRRKGQFCGGKIPYGYYVTDKKVQVDEEKAEVVRFMQDANDKEKTTLKLLLKEKKQTQTALDNIVKAIERDIMSDSTNRRLNELEQQARELDEKIAVERNKVAFLLTEDDMRRYYLTAIRQEPQLLISTLVKEILLYDDKMLITYNTPLHEGSDDDRGFSFYEKTLFLPCTAPQSGETTLLPVQTVMRV